MKCVVCPSHLRSDIETQLRAGEALEAISRNLAHLGEVIAPGSLRTHQKRHMGEPGPSHPPLPETASAAHPAAPATALGLDVIEPPAGAGGGLVELVRDTGVALDTIVRNQLAIVEQRQREHMAGTGPHPNEEIAALKTLQSIVGTLRAYQEAEFSAPVDRRVTLPAIRTAADIRAALQAIADAAASGRITHPEAQTLVQVVEGQRRALMTEYLERRILELEQLVCSPTTITLPPESSTPLLPS